MTRLVQCGWETGLPDQAGAAGVNQFTAPAAVSSSPAARSGLYCLRCSAVNQSCSSSSLVGAYSRVVIPHATVTEVWYAFGYWWSHSGEPGAPGLLMLHTLDAGGNFNLVITNDAGVMRAYYANGGSGIPVLANLVAIGAASTPMAASTWCHVEVRLVAATGATGTLEIWLNGVRVLNATAVRTAQATANNNTLVLEYASGQALSTHTCHHVFDDLRIQDTAGTRNNARPGDEAIRLIVPNAAGDLTQLTRAGTDSGANWSQVDEVPADTADYVTGAGAGLTDLYHRTDLAATTVSAVNVLALASNAAGGGTVALVVKTPAGQSAGTAVSLGTTWGWTNRLLETDPSGGAAWDSAKLAAVQIGCAVG